MTPSLNPKLKCSFELIDLLYDRLQILKRMQSHEPDLYERLKYVNRELRVFEN